MIGALTCAGTASAQPEVSAPRPRDLPPPAWPPEAVAEGPVDVLLDVVIQEDGSVSEVEVVSSDPGAPPAAPEEQAMFAELAERYVRGLIFEPARRGEVAVAARLRFRVHFDRPPRALEPDVAEDADERWEAEVREGDGGAATSEPDSPPEPASASDAASEPASEPESEPPQGESFSARAQVEGPTSDSVSAGDRRIEVGALGRVPRRDAQSMLTLAPGILLSNHGGEGHAASMFLRGFDAGEGEDLEVLLDGIPLNDVSNAHGHGYADTSFVIPELIESLRVVQGPFDPAQGDFAVAGTAELHLGLPERGLHANAAYGSYHDRRLWLFWGPEGQPSATFVGVSLRAGDGWGTNRSHALGSAIAQVEIDLHDHWKLTLLAFAGASTWRQAGPLRLDDFETRRLPCAPDDFSQFFCTYDASQGGSAQRLGGSATLVFHEGPTQARLLVHGGGHALRVRENFTGFTEDPRTDGGLQRGDAVDQRYDAATVGLRGTLEHRFVLFDQVQRVEAGVVARHDEASSVQDRIRAELDVPYRSDFDRGIRVTGVGAHLRLDATPIEWLSISGGARADVLAFGVLDRARPSMDRIGERLTREATSAFGYLIQPRGTVRARFLGANEEAALDWVTSAGLGARSSDAAALSEGELAPFAEVVAVESGLVCRIGDEASEERGGGHLECGSSIFATRVTSDLVFDARRGRNTPTGPSSRVGWMAYARLRWDRWLDASASLTWTRGHLPPPGAEALDLFAGPRLPFIPEWLLRLDAAARHAVVIEGERIEGSLAVGALYLSERPLPLDRSSDPWFVLDAAASVRWRWFELGVSVENLLDARYRQSELNYVSNFEPDRAPSMMAARHFVAGPPLRVLGRLSVRFELGGPS